MYGAEQQMHSPAFDHPETRAAWERTRRRVRGRFLLWTLIFVVLLVLSAALSEPSVDSGYRRGGTSGPWPMVSGLALLWYLCVLYASLGALSRLKKARSVLEAYPWQQFPAVRKAGRESTGVLVQLPLADAAPGGGGLRKDRPGGAAADGGQWTPTMCARDPRRWNIWDERMERGAWFAGDPGKWGVLALPGGEGMMTVQRSMANINADRSSAKKDLEGVLASASPRG
jgi:hypothetical protein